MKMKLKQIILLLVALLSLTNLKAETIEVNLADFATYASEANNINILIDDELKNENIIFIINSAESYFLEAFRKAVSLKGLELVQTEQFYYVRKKDIYLEEDKYRSIKLNFVKYEDIANFLKVYEDKIKFEFISTSKTLLIKSKENEFNSIKEMIKSVDTLPKQLKLKVTILDTNLDKLKELGSDTSNINLQNDGNFFFNLVSYPFSVNNQVPTTKKDNFYTFLKYLNQTGTSEFISNPVLTLSDEKQTVFNVVNNIPFKMGSVTVDNQDTRTTSSYDYKDVGTQISVTPHIYSDDNIYLDLELNVSNVLSSADNLPTTTKKYIKQSFHLPLNKLLVLTRINKKELITNYSEIPVLADIPFLGWFFKYESKEENRNNLSIVFELINENDFETKNFNIKIIPNKIEG